MKWNENVTQTSPTGFNGTHYLVNTIQNMRKYLFKNKQIFKTKGGSYIYIAMGKLLQQRKAKMQAISSAFVRNKQKTSSKQQIIGIGYFYPLQPE